MNGEKRPNKGSPPPAPRLDGRLAIGLLRMDGSRPCGEYGAAMGPRSEYLDMKLVGHLHFGDLPRRADRRCLGPVAPRC